MIELKKLANSVLQLLQDDPRRYRNFGVYWYLVKEVLKRYYTQDNLYLLGNYVDENIVGHVPDHDSLQDALAAAIETYNQNASFNLGSAQIALPDGGTALLLDRDADGL